MARPQKAGIEYFPLNVTMDDEIDMIEAKFGVAGFGILIKLYQIIYDNGYYIMWTDREVLLYKKRINAEINIINDIVNECLKWGIFNTDMYNKFNILTSGGIQRRYIEATQRRKDIGFISDYMLVDLTGKYPTRVNVSIYSTNADINSKNADIGTQSKVKEIKVKESKVEEIGDDVNVDINSESKLELDAAPGDGLTDLQPELVLNAVSNLDAVPEDNCVQVIEYFQGKAMMISSSPKDFVLAQSLAAEIPVKTIKQGIDEAFRRYKPKHDGDKIRTLKYCEGCIRDAWEIEKIKSKGGSLNGSGTSGSSNRTNHENEGKFKFKERSVIEYTDEELKQAGIQ